MCLQNVVQQECILRLGMYQEYEIRVEAIFKC